MKPLSDRDSSSLAHQTNRGPRGGPTSLRPTRSNVSTVIAPLAGDPATSLPSPAADAPAPPANAVTRSAKPICGHKILLGAVTESGFSGAVVRVPGPRSLPSASSPAAKVRQCQPAECDQQVHPCGDSLHGLRGYPADTPIQPERPAENENDRRFWWPAAPLGSPLFERDVSKKPVVYSDLDRRGDCTCRLVCRRAAQGPPG